MPGPNWHDDEDSQELASNLTGLYPDLIGHASSSQAPTMALVQDWHTRMHRGLAVPSECYVGNFRGSVFADLLDYEVTVGGIRATRSYRVFGEVEQVLEWLVEELDEIEAEAPSADRDTRVLAAAARLHGEWVRIHPFANGNGRTARLWVAWVLARFGMASPLRVRPRPAAPYGIASKASMAGVHEPMLTLLLQLYSADSLS